MDITLLQLEKEDIILLTKVIGGLSSLIIIILGWYIHRQTEKIKVMENLITEKKNEAYSSFVGLFYDLLAQSKENKSFDTHDGLITRVRGNILKSKEQKNIRPTKGGHKMVTCQNYVSLFYCQITSCPSDGGIS